VEAEQKQRNKNILNSLAAVIHKNERNAAGNNENVVHHCHSCLHSFAVKLKIFNLMFKRTSTSFVGIYQKCLFRHNMAQNYKPHPNLQVMTKAITHLQPLSFPLMGSSHSLRSTLLDGLSVAS